MAIVRFTVFSAPTSHGDRLAKNYSVVNICGLFLLWFSLCTLHVQVIQRASDLANGLCADMCVDLCGLAGSMA